MKVAITAWENRISPVFDSASTLLIAEIKNSEIIARAYEPFNPAKVSHLAEALKNMGIDILICGAISKILSNVIEFSGITLIPFIGGNVEEVLECYTNGRKIVPEFLLPGCGQRRCQNRTRYHENQNSQKEVVIMPKKDGKGPHGQKAGTGKGAGGCPQGKGGRLKGQGKGMGQGKGQGCGQGQGGNR